MLLAQRGQIAFFGEPVVFEGVGVVDLAPLRCARAAGEAACLVPVEDPAAQRLRHRVFVWVELEWGVVDRVDEDPVQSGGLCGEPAGGVGVDRPVAVQLARFLGLADQGRVRDRQLRHGHEDLGAGKGQTRHPRPRGALCGRSGWDQQ
jgi:hypothetical protein